MAATRVVMRLHGCKAPLARAAELLSMRAPTRISSDLAVWGRVTTSPRKGADSGRGCLVTVELEGTDRSMPECLVFDSVEDDAVLFDRSSMWDVAKRCRIDDGLARKPIGDCVLVDDDLRLVLVFRLSHRIPCRCVMARCRYCCR